MDEKFYLEIEIVSIDPASGMATLVLILELESGDQQIVKEWTEPLWKVDQLLLVGYKNKLKSILNKIEEVLAE
jgi:hypothetical protein